MVTRTLAEQRITLTDKAAMLRLVEKARAEGVQLKQDTDGNYWATSVSHPGRLHALQPMHCTCQGFAHHGRCKHLAALHQHLGWLENLPEPTTAVENCPVCDGMGAVESKRSRWIGSISMGFRDEWTVAEPCTSCNGTGTLAPKAA